MCLLTAPLSAPSTRIMLDTPSGLVFSNLTPCTRGKLGYGVRSATRYANIIHFQRTEMPKKKLSEIPKGVKLVSWFRVRSK